MEPSKIRNANFTYAAPPGTQDVVGDLHVRVGNEPELGRSISSAWSLSSEERDVLLAGGKVVLTVYGKGHPIVSLGVEPV